MKGWPALFIAVLLLAACNRGEAPTPSAKSTHPIEEREGLWYATGTTNLFSGTLSQQYPSGTNSAESVYANGFKLSQRAWHTNGMMQSEFIFHRGRLAIRRSWDANGTRLAWRQERLAAEQAQRGFDLLHEGRLVEGYVWIHIAAANGQQVARQALQQFSPAMTEAQQAEAQVVADRLLGRVEGGKKGGD